MNLDTRLLTYITVGTTQGSGYVEQESQDLS